MPQVPLGLLEALSLNSLTGQTIHINTMDPLLHIRIILLFFQVMIVLDPPQTSLSKAKIYSYYDDSDIPYNHSSHVGNINGRPDEELFSVLTETDDIHGRWSVITTTEGIEFNHREDGLIEVAHRAVDDMDTIISHDVNLEKQKCITAFINKHLHLDQCRRYCTSLGSSYFRWFHDGCCECVGKYCLNYGIDEPKCLIARVLD